MIDFFASKFNFDFQVNEKFMEAIEQQDLTFNKEVRSQMCHILNVHHLWVSRLLGLEVVSEDWDDLPFYAWQQLNQENLNQTFEFLENEVLPKNITYIDSDGVTQEKDAANILYHILQHATHHRAVINTTLRKIGAIPVEMNFIQWEDK